MILFRNIRVGATILMTLICAVTMAQGIDGITSASPLQQNEKINRKKVLDRNNPVVREVDILASLSIGNGHFATTVDVTGLQSFPDFYRNGVPLCAMSDWGWHRFPNTENLKEGESQQSVRFPFRNHDEVYAVEYKKGGREQAATNYFRLNPHRLNLGTIGLQFFDAVGKVVGVQNISDIRQELKLHSATIVSEYKVCGKPFEVTTACMPEKDAMIYRVKSSLLKDENATVTIRFSYPTGVHSDDANDWTKPELHSSKIVNSSDKSAVIERVLDDTHYYLVLRWEGKATLQESQNNCFTLKTSDAELSFEAHYTKDNIVELSADKLKKQEVFSFSRSLAEVQRWWKANWQNGGFVDFADCADPRAKELERRVVLSQYLTQINCMNDMPPQETGLTYNSWFGRPHLEMTWWHGIDFALWSRADILKRWLKWYDATAANSARKIAERQKFKGLRWMKMTDPWAGEAPSNTGSFLIWQQPHYIYMAEELYRVQPIAETLQRYGKLVEETAEWMADFVMYDSVSQQYQLRGATAMQETMTKSNSYNQPFELAYWRYGLQVAQSWRERQGLLRHAKWDKILQQLSPLPVKDGIYSAGIPLIDKAELELKSRSDHPAVLGACGMLPSTDGFITYDPQIMKSTLDWVLQNWNWDTTWGWDYGMIAMCAARLGQTDVAVDMLLCDKTKNRYLISGHNYQTADRLRLYLPGNGALLTAVAMMCVGWDGCPQIQNPGFPKDGKWNVRWEGLKKMQ